MGRDLMRALLAAVEATPRTRGEAIAQVALVAAVWPRLDANGRRKVRTAAERLAGLVERRTDRRTGQRIGVYSAESGLVDVDCAADGVRRGVRGARLGRARANAARRALDVVPGLLRRLPRGVRVVAYDTEIGR